MGPALLKAAVFACQSRQANIHMRIRSVLMDTQADLSWKMTRSAKARLSRILQLQCLRERAAEDAAAVARLQEAAAALTGERAAALQQSADACSAAGVFRRRCRLAERRAVAAETFAAAVRRGTAFDAAEDGLATCGDELLQANHDCLHA